MKSFIRITSLQEIRMGTDTGKPDTDGDGIPTLLIETLELVIQIEELNWS
ncbi:hypothetical protein [Virgibacillus pantothenticus]|nr:hypothetical protein [Virgibacillus pantothenticus]